MKIKSYGTNPGNNVSKASTNDEQVTEHPPNSDKVTANRLEILDTQGTTWIVLKRDAVFEELSQKIADGRKVFETWEVIPELRIARANDLLHEAEIIEQSSWESKDWVMRKVWFQKLQEWGEIVKHLDKAVLTDLAKRLTDEIQVCQNWDRHSRLITQLGIIHGILEEKEDRT